MTLEDSISALEEAWDVDGFLGQVREGHYSEAQGAALLSLIDSIVLPPETGVPKRLVSLLWYLPSFLEWQTKRVGEKGGDVQAYERFAIQVLNTLQRVLGVP